MPSPTRIGNMFTQPTRYSAKTCEFCANMAPGDWMLHLYWGQSLNKVEPVPISVTGFVTVFTMSHFNISHGFG